MYIYLQCQVSTHQKEKTDQWLQDPWTRSDQDRSAEKGERWSHSFSAPWLILIDLCDVCFSSYLCWRWLYLTVFPDFDWSPTWLSSCKSWTNTKKHAKLCGIKLCCVVGVVWWSLLLESSDTIYLYSAQLRQLEQIKSLASLNKTPDEEVSNCFHVAWIKRCSCWFQSNMSAK